VSDERTAVRIAAKEVLVDGYLGAAHDIAWGDWKEKEKSVPRWLDRAVAAVDDLIANEGVSEEIRFHVHARAMAALVGLHGGLDPALSAKEIQKSGKELIAATKDPMRKSQYEWEFGMALYDALQIAQMRSDTAEALTYGEMAVEHLEKSVSQSPTPASNLFLGRLPAICFWVACSSVSAPFTLPAIMTIARRLPGSIKPRRCSTNRCRTPPPPKSGAMAKRL
jgi:hypothetical protein